MSLSNVYVVVSETRARCAQHCYTRVFEHDHSIWHLLLQGQNFESSLLRVPLRFARQQLPQLNALQPKQACSIPAELLLLPPGIRQPSLATNRVSLPGGLCVVRYDFLKEGNQSKFEYRSHGFVQAHSQCKQICQDAWFLVGEKQQLVLIF